MQRRDVLKAGAAVPFLASLPEFAWAKALPAPGLFIYDRRFEAARRMLRDMAHDPHAVHAISGDVTALWRDDLRTRWRQAGGLVAGVTTPRSLFCLEQLARDQFHRVLISRSVAMSDGDLIAWTIGPVSPSKGAA